MPRAPRRPGSSRRPGAEAGTPRESIGPRPTEAPARPLDARETEIPAPSVSQEAAVVQEAADSEPPATAPAARSETAGTSRAAPRFQIFVIDAGWNSPAHKILKENFSLLRALQKGDPIYVLNREKSIEYIRRNRSLIGKDPIIAVHDLNALRATGTTRFHGFRLHLGLLRTGEQVLLALQLFSRFLVTHRQSADLEALIRARLRHEGILGGIEIILNHEPREIGG
jgi:hypothetical protein